MGMQQGCTYQEVYQVLSVSCARMTRLQDHSHYPDDIWLKNEHGQIEKCLLGGVGYSGCFRGLDPGDSLVP